MSEPTIDLTKPRCICRNPLKVIHPECPAENHIGAYNEAAIRDEPDPVFDDADNLITRPDKC